MEAERQSDSIPDIELAELPPNDQSALLMQTAIIAQLDFSICFFDILFSKKCYINCQYLKFYGTTNFY